MYGNVSIYKFWLIAAGHLELWLQHVKKLLRLEAVLPCQASTCEKACGEWLQGFELISQLRRPSGPISDTRQHETWDTMRFAPLFTLFVPILPGKPYLESSYLKWFCCCCTLGTRFWGCLGVLRNVGPKVKGGFAAIAEGLFCPITIHLWLVRHGTRTQCTEIMLV